MLYLIKLDENYKIGFTDNIEKRLKQFESTHIVVEVLALREGGIREEKILQKVCNTYHLKNELFKVNECVVNIFKTYLFDNISLVEERLREELNLCKKELIEKDNYIRELLLQQVETIKNSISLQTYILNYNNIDISEILN